MKYITQTLAKNEEIVYKGLISKWVFAWVYILVAATVFFVVPLLALVWVAIIIKSTEMAVTNKRVIVKTGWIMRDTTELKLSKVESVNVSQGLSGRLFNYGTVTVNGTGVQKVIMKNIKDPIKVREVISEICDV
jgi:uncharacterized membrane protein YdbT with pleckstrin-like domain